MIRFALIAASTLGFFLTAALGNLMVPLLRAFQGRWDEPKARQAPGQEAPDAEPERPPQAPTMGGLCLMVGVLAAVGVGWTAACVAQPELLGAESLFSVRLLTALLGALLFGGVGLLEDLARIRSRSVLGLRRHTRLGLEAAAGAAVEVVYVRKGEQRQTTLLPVWDTQNAQWRAGMWVRDSSAGVGTLTFVDAQAGVFAGLGHPISDSDTGEQVALRSGEIVPCQIVGCTSGTVGSPGELKGRFLSTHALGSICINSKTGVYGRTRAAFSGPELEMAFAQEVVPGDAEIWTTVDGEVPKAYRIRIEKVNDADPHRNMILRVTDRQLLAKTGGIVQGMSGSPILQNGRLVGAVTHVLVNDPTRGYGIFAQTMLKQARAVEKTDDAAQP